MAATLANVAYTLPEISEGDTPCTDDSWTATNTIAPAGRAAHTAVWTGSEMIVWGGREWQRFEHRWEIQSRHRYLDTHQHHRAQCPIRAHGSVDWQ